MTHALISRKGGLSTSPEKREAVAANLEKARAALVNLRKHNRRMKRSLAKARAQLKVA